MTQSLSGIEPVVGCGDDLSLNLPGRTAMADPFASLLNPAAMERFQSAMADGGAEAGRAVPPEPPGMKDGVDGTFTTRERNERHGRLDAGCERAMPVKDVPEERISAGRGAPAAPQRRDDMPMRWSGDAESRGNVTAQEAESTDESFDRIVNASESAPKAMAVEQSPKVEASIQIDRAESPNAKSVPSKRTDVIDADVRKAEVCVVEVGRAVSPKPPEVKDGASGTFTERALPEKGVPARHDGGFAPQNQDRMPMRRHGDALPCQSIVKPHEMPSDSQEPVQVIAPAPLPIKLPAAALEQKSVVPVATPDVVRMFVAAAEAVADAIFVSSGFENGEGRIHVRLQPEVLSGSEVQITVKSGTLTVVVNPASHDVQTIVEANRTQFEQHLAEKVHSWRVAVAVRRGVKSDVRV